MGVPHVKGCRCEACLEGRTVQHPAGCLCDGCQERDAATSSGGVTDLIRGLGKRVDKAADAFDAAKDAAAKMAGVLTPRERAVAERWLRRLLDR